MDGVPQVSGLKADLAEGIDLITFLADSKILPSKGEARKMVQNGGISINKEKITQADAKIKEDHLLNGQYVLIQKGKSKYTLAIFG